MSQPPVQQEQIDEVGCAQAQAADRQGIVKRVRHDAQAVDADRALRGQADAGIADLGEGFGQLHQVIGLLPGLIPQIAGGTGNSQQDHDQKRGCSDHKLAHGWIPRHDGEQGRRTQPARAAAHDTPPWSA